MYKREEAVSPVIGVILMVAITVILAAVIAAFVFGMTGNVQKQRTVSLVAEANSTVNTQVDLTNHGGKDIADVSSFVVSVGGTVQTAVGGAANNLTATVGDTASYGGGSATDRDRVIVTAVFRDGSSSVVLDTTV